MLKIEHINVYYADVQVLWDVSLHVSPGEIVTVIGPNGSGKSTLLKTILNLLPPRGDEGDGKISFLEKEIRGLPPEETVRMGLAIVPEGGRVFPEMTVLENLKMGSYIEKARRERKETLDEVFGLFPRLKERLQQKARTLSGGERQMLAMGRALMSKPRLLLLDEPTLGLQPILAQKTFQAIREVHRRGVAVLLVEQNVQFSLEISQRACVLENGRIVLEGKGGDLLASEHIKKYYLAL